MSTLFYCYWFTQVPRLWIRRCRMYTFKLVSHSDAPLPPLTLTLLGFMGFLGRQKLLKLLGFCGFILVILKLSSSFSYLFHISGGLFRVVHMRLDFSFSFDRGTRAFSCLFNQRWFISVCTFFNTMMCELCRFAAPLREGGRGECI